MTFPIYSSYQESGVDWLGAIPAHWKISRLRFLCGITTGNRDTQDAQESGEYPFFVRSDHIEKIDSYSFDGEGVFTSGDGAGVGKIFHYYNGKCEVHQRVYLFYNFQHVCGKFFYEYLKTMLEPVVLSQSAKSTVDSLRLPMLQNFWMTCPPKNEQLKILSFLDHEVGKIDALIAEQEKLIALLKEKRQAVISHAVTKGLNPDAPMKDSRVEWLGQVPEHWEIKRVKNIFRLTCEASDDDHGMELLSVYSDIGVRPRREMVAKGNKATDINGYWLVKSGDLVVNKLLAWMGAVGYSAYDGVTSPAYDILRPIDKVNSKFYHYLFRDPIVSSEFKRWSRGIMEMRLRLYFDELGGLPMPFPPITEQDAIVQEIEAMETKFGELITEAESVIELSKERRSALISAAVTGRIDVRGWQPPAAQ